MADASWIKIVWIVALSLAIALTGYLWAESWVPILDTTWVEMCPGLRYIDSISAPSDAYVSQEEPSDVSIYPGAISVVKGAVIYPTRLLVQDPDSPNGLWEYEREIASVAFLSNKHIVALAGKEHQHLLLLTVSHSPIFTRHVEMPKLPEGQVPMRVVVDHSILKVYCGRPDLYTPDRGGTIHRYEIVRRNPLNN